MARPGASFNARRISWTITSAVGCQLQITKWSVNSICLSDEMWRRMMSSRTPFENEPNTYSRPPHEQIWMLTASRRPWVVRGKTFWSLPIATSTNAHARNCRKSMRQRPVCASRPPAMRCASSELLMSPPATQVHAAMASTTATVHTCRPIHSSRRWLPCRIAVAQRS